MRRRRWRGGLLAALLAGLTASGGWAIEVPLKFVKAPEQVTGQADREFFPHCWAFNRDATKTLPAGNWKLPKLIAKEPIYLLAQFGPDKRLMVMDQNGEKDTHYTKLYFDANGNADLTDDKPVVGKFASDNGWPYKGNNYPNVECTLKGVGRELPYVFQPIVQQVDDWGKQNSSTMVGLSVACWYVGECELEGRRYKLGLYDNNRNGRFHDFCRLPKRQSKASDTIYLEGDRLFIWAADGKGSWSNGAPLSKRLCAGSKVYDVGLNMQAGKLILTETKDKLVAIRIPKGIEQLALMGESGDQVMAAVNPGETLNVPEGRYRLLSYNGKLADADGNTWQLEARATGKTPFVAADPKAENPLLIGEPITVAARVPGWMMVNIKNGGEQALKEVRLECALRDAGQRQISSLQNWEGMNKPSAKSAFKRSTKRPDMPAEPTYEIRDSKGKKVTSGSFEYG